MSHLPPVPSETAKDIDLARDIQMPGEYMTTNQGLKVGDDQNSLKAGVRGPTLIEDLHFREKINHFDHERIPERVVHARGAAAHGYFECTHPMTEFTKASFLSAKGKTTPVFQRFSTVAGSRGSADTPRDVRGFAVKFYTDDGIWDMVGNNMPIFFIQDAIKFPDLIHAVKPEPDREIPQAQSAHDTFYDFASLTPEISHMLMWVMSDRGMPRSFATMPGFGIHAYRLINAAGKSVFVKFHFKPKKGTYSLCWDEAQKVAGKDPDFNRKDLWESIERGDYPEWEFGVQIVQEEDQLKYGFDILDATKIIPEELVPVTPVGKLVLNRNPDNYFAETEQVVFSPGHIVPGIDFSNDPLLQGRLFSYLDTSLKRVGPNFAQLPINRPTCPMHNNQRDGESTQVIPKGRVSYFPNSLGNGCPMHSPEAAQSLSAYAEKMDGHKVRARSDSFSDHFSQATLFWNSMANWEKSHIIAALSFELNMLTVPAIQQRTVDELLANISMDLATSVAENIGVTVKATPKHKGHDKKSPALSMDVVAKAIKGRKVAILAGDGVSAADVTAMMSALAKEGALCEVINKNGQPITADDGSSIAVDKAAPNAASVLYDAVFVPGKVATALSKMGIAVHFLSEAYAHFKPVCITGDFKPLLTASKVDPAAPGVVTGTDATAVAANFIEAMKKHRFFERSVDAVPA